MSTIRIDIESASKISATFSGAAGWSDKDPLRIVFTTNGAQSKNDAIQLIKDALEKNGRDWFEYRDEEWILKADNLRGDSNDLNRFTWLTGMFPVKPVFSEQPININGVPKGPNVWIEVLEP